MQMEHVYTGSVYSGNTSKFQVMHRVRFRSCTHMHIQLACCTELCTAR